MARLLVISEDQLRSVVERAVMEAVDVIVRAAATLEVDLAGSSPATQMAVSEPQPLVEGRVYRIGTKKGHEHSYADVIAKEYNEYEFAFKDAWAKVKDRMITNSPRARASARRSLDKDKRFARIHNRRGVWFRRMDRTEPALPF